MADTWVSGGRLDNDTSTHDLYTAAADAIIEICICNQGPTPVQVDLAFAPGGAAASPAHYRLFTFEIAAYDAWIYPRPLKLKDNDVLRVKSHTANQVSFTYDGIEVT